MADPRPEEYQRAPVYEFDYLAGPDLLRDCHEAYLGLKVSAPPVFWTNSNGGHWVVTTKDAVLEVLRQPEIYSSRNLAIPPNPGQPRMIPESLDPPEHRAYRQLLRPFFDSKAIEPLSARIEAWARKLINGVSDAGECDFVAEVGSPFPVSVFMEFFGFPLDRFDFFRSTVVAFFATSSSIDDRAALSMQIVKEIAGLVDARRTNPEDDLISDLVSLDFEGRQLNDEELISIGFLMFLAGLDTVVNALTFGMRHLATDPETQRLLIAEPDRIPGAVEELMRRYTFVAVPRYVIKDTELAGTRIPAGDSILAPLHMIGWDEGLNPCPLEVDIDRGRCRHAAFGSGIHTCLGIHLARMEMATFYRVWFELIGEFEIIDKGPLKCRGGPVQALEKLHLCWSRKGNRQ